MGTIETVSEIRAAPPDCFLGRQPIYDARREIRAYELLYRRRLADGAAMIDNGDQATAEVLLEAFVEIGLAQVSPEQPVFINHTERLLGMHPIVPPDRCVIEVLEDVPVNSGTVHNLERLRHLGYRIALDDFVYSDAHVPFLRLAHYVKLDVRGMPVAEFRNQVKILKSFPVKIVAEKVESEEEFQKSKALGCELFQGYYLRKPEVLRGCRIPANRMSALSLLSECMDPQQSATAIAAVIARDAALSYGLLRLANCALHGRKQQIQSSAQAIAWLGMDRVFRWASLLVLSRSDDCPIGYLAFALQRARTCELVAQVCGRPTQAAYLMGLLSTLDAILNAPLNDIIEPLPLDALCKSAILERAGDLGAILDSVTGYEAGYFEIGALHGIPIQQVQKAFWEAVEYSATMMDELRIAR